MTTPDFDRKTLEFDKILELLCAFTALEDAAAQLRGLKPSGDYDESVRLSEETRGAYELAMKHGSPSIRSVANLSAAVRRAFMGASLSLSELLGIAHGLRQMRELKGYRSRCEGITTALDGAFSRLYADRALEDRITESILSPEEVADDASSQLRSIRRNIAKVSDSIKTSLDSLIHSAAYSKYLQEPIITMRDSRFVVPVKSEYRTLVPGLVHDMSSSGATVFVEPMAVVEANNQIRILRSEEKTEIERIVAELSALAGGCAEGYEDGFAAMIRIDATFAKAEYGIENKSFFPVLTKNRAVELYKARHPLIDPKQVVPIDIALGKGYSTLVITGPNTGGKTVCLKTLGLLSMMAQCGLMIPAAEQSSVCVFRGILADIGDEQSIEQSLSTFSGHMKKIVSVMEKANEETLVLLDELGAGTDPVEGAALAVAIIEELRGKGCRIAATTHYAEIKVYALENDDVENASCEFDIETLRPTYRLVMGIPGRSNAFAISGRLGLSEGIIENAKSHLSTKDSSFERVVATLNEQKKKVEDELTAARRAEESAGRLKAEAEAERERIRSMAEAEVEKAKRTAAGIIADVKVQAERISEEIEALKKFKNQSEITEAAGRARALLRGELSRLEDSANPVMQEEDDDYVLPRLPVPGDEVLLKHLGSRGVVTEIDAQGGTVTLTMGSVKTKVPLSDVRLHVGQGKTRPVVSTHTGIRKVTRDAATTVDVRGMNAEEAIMEVDRFIDNCVLTGIESATVIHGIGTGVLKAALRQHFKKHKNVRTHRPGVYGEGEDGVTIIELK